MKTVKVCYSVHPWYCPKCKALYFSEVDCQCDKFESSWLDQKIDISELIECEDTHFTGKVTK